MAPIRWVGFSYFLLLPFLRSKIRSSIWNSLDDLQLTRSAMSPLESSMKAPSTLGIISGFGRRRDTLLHCVGGGHSAKLLDTDFKLVCWFFIAKLVGNRYFPEFKIAETDCKYTNFLSFVKGQLFKSKNVVKSYNQLLNFNRENIAINIISKIYNLFTQI